MLLDERNKVGLLDLLVGRHVNGAVKEVERCLMIMAEGGPHHDTPSSPTVCLSNTAVGVLLTSSPPHSGPSVWP